MKHKNKMLVKFMKADVNNFKSNAGIKIRRRYFKENSHSCNQGENNSRKLSEAGIRYAVYFRSYTWI